jgi:hypothetical protein
MEDHDVKLLPLLVLAVASGDVSQGEMIDSWNFN